MVQAARGRRGALPRNAPPPLLAAPKHRDFHAPARAHKHLARVGKDRKPGVLARARREPAEALEDPAGARAVHARNKRMPALVADDLVLHADGVRGSCKEQAANKRGQETAHAGGVGARAYMRQEEAMLGPRGTTLFWSRLSCGEKICENMKTRSRLCYDVAKKSAQRRRRDQG